MFRGRFELKLDPKGRVKVPPAYRQILLPAKSKASPQVVITNSQYNSQRCLDVYTLKEWEKLEKKFFQKNSLMPEVQAYQRFYLASGQVVQLDAQNRFLIPQSLRKYSGLGENQDVMLVGMGAKFEIWKVSEWNKLFNGLANDFEKNLNVIASIGGE